MNHTPMRSPVPDAFVALRDDARGLLTAWHPASARQRSLRAEYLTRLEQPDAVWRHGGGTHLTASAYVYDHTLTRTALVLHRKAGLWLQPGGHLERGDAGLVAAALREVREETGLHDLVAALAPADLHRHELPAAFGRCRVHLDVRVAVVLPEAQQLRVSDESDAVAWWPVDAVPDPTDPDLRGALAAVRDELAAQAPACSSTSSGTAGDASEA